MLESLGPVLAKHPEYAEHKIIERICEPERQIIFRVPWQDDRGEVHINRGFRVEFNSALGPYKGGLRFHPSVYLGIVKFLGFEQIFKNALTGMPIGGGKGGSDFDPKGRSDDEIMRFCQSFMTELYRHLGEYTDVPAGDIGVGDPRDRLPVRPVQADHQPLRVRRPHRQGPRLGRRARAHGGHRLRRGLLRRARCSRPAAQSLDGKTCVVSGSGNVAIYAIEKIQQLGGKVVACSDSDGVRPRPGRASTSNCSSSVKEVERGRISDYAEQRSGATLSSTAATSGSIPCDVALPVRDPERARRPGRRRRWSTNGCIAVAEGANMPTTPEAVRVLQRRRRRLRPGQGGQRRRRGDLRARDAAERQPRLAGRSSTPSSGWPRS